MDRAGRIHILRNQNAAPPPALAQFAEGSLPIEARLRAPVRRLLIARCTGAPAELRLSDATDLIRAIGVRPSLRFDCSLAEDP
jgi:hypothetical protein